jgi:hypothetical protein
MKMLSIQGVFLTTALFWIILSSVSAQGPPFVLNANNVPVGGGTLQIYGLNFGKDASVIEVEIVDTTNQNTFECVNVSVVIPNSIVSCSIVDIGTGRSKHIAITVNGISNEKYDTNTLFNRHAPKLSSVSYNPDTSVVLLEGLNFGIDASRVNVSLDGFIYPVTAVTNTAITCQLPAEYYLDNTTAAFVLVDGQKSVQNVPVVRYSTSQEDEVVSAGSPHNSNWMSSDNAVMVAVIASVVFGLILVSVIVGILTRKRRTINFGSTDGSSGANKSVEMGNVKRDSGEVVLAIQLADPSNPVSRATSMEEIDLNAEPIYEHNSPALSVSSSSSSSSSSLSPYSSTSSSPANSPFGSPGGERKENTENVVKSDDNEDGDDNNDDETNTTTEYDSPSPAPSPVPSLSRNFTKTRRDLPQISTELPDVTFDASADPTAVKTEAATAIAAALVAKTDFESSPVIPIFPKVRRAMPPPLALDPLAATKKKSAFSKPMTPPFRNTTVQGMIRVPSSRLANRAKTGDCAKQGSVFDSPEVGITQSRFDSPNIGISQSRFDSPNIGISQSRFDSPIIGISQSRFDSPIIGMSQSRFDSPILGISQGRFDSPNL